MNKKEAYSLNNHSFNASEGIHTQVNSFGLNSAVIGGLVGLAQWTEFGANFFVGPLADKIGYDIPLFIGYFIVIISSLGFAFADSYAALVLWRASEGVGAAFVITSGTAHVANMYRDDEKERGKMIAIVLCGMSFGLSVGPPFASLLYLTGKKFAPFVAIAAIAFILSLLQLYVRTPKIDKRQTVESSGTMAASFRLVKDPYILICSLLILMGYLGPAFLEGTLPLYMMEKLGAATWMAGVVFVPFNVAFALAVPILMWLSPRIGRWPIVFVIYIFGALALFGYGSFNSFAAMMVLGIPVGMQTAMIDAILYPLMAYLVDIRIKETVYGSAYALANIATSAAFGIGPILAGALTTAIGFKGSMFAVAGLTLTALIPLGLLRKPIIADQIMEEKESLLPKGILANGVGTTGKSQTTQ